MHRMRRETTVLDRQEAAPRGSSVCLRLSITLLALVLLGGVLAGCSDALTAARDLEARGDLPGAVEVYRELLQEEPNDLDALRSLALDLLLLNRRDDALEVQEKIVSLDPKDSLTRVELAFNYLNHQNRPADAVVYLKQATELEPSAKNWAFLAQAQIEVDDLPGAENSLTRSLEADPTYPLAYSLLVGLLESEGRSAEALDVRQQAASNGVTLRE